MEQRYSVYGKDGEAIVDPCCLSEIVKLLVACLLFDDNQSKRSTNDNNSSRVSYEMTSTIFSLHTQPNRIQLAKERRCSDRSAGSEAFWGSDSELMTSAEQMVAFSLIQSYQIVLFLVGTSLQTRSWHMRKEQGHARPI